MNDFLNVLYLRINPRQKNKTPTDTAIIEIILINKFNSLLKGVSSPPDEEARLAI